MSLNRLKETLLRPCSRSAAAADFNAVGSAFISVSSEPSIENAPVRKPPKSSLSQQLQRLDPPSFPPIGNLSTGPSPIGVANGRRRGGRGGGDGEEEEGDGEEPAPVAREAAALQSFDLGARGPFEPLLLSSPGESPVVQVPESINCRLLEHQREGVKFLYGLYKNNHGGVLGDDMGLGKTIQTIAFLAAVLGKDIENADCHMDEKNGTALILCPTSVLHNWENELAEWGNFKVAIYHGPNRDLILEKLAAHLVEIVITSFDTFRNQDQIMREILWDIVIVDEAHRLKNEKSQFYKSCLGIKTTRRYGLTGTIIQNKILELFNLFDWFSPGSLGTREHFRDFYDEPLKHGQRLSAPQRFIQIADGYIAGILCAVVSHLADNLVSVLNNAKGATAADAARKLGLLGLFTRGLPLRIVMISTLTGAQWGIYDAFNVFVGLPTTGGATLAPALLPVPVPDASKMSSLSSSWWST